jgi:glycosyltransferase involved in cell wall biosynthesis
MQKLYINGRFLTQRLTGVQRFAAEVIKAIDLLLQDGDWDDWDVRVLVPHDSIEHLRLKKAKIEHVGRLKGHPWEQMELLERSADGVLLSLCNAGPVLHPRQLVVIHDVAVYRERKAYSRAYGTLHRILGRLLSRTAHLATVSEFSRLELAKIFGLDPRSIVVAPNGAEHIQNMDADMAILHRLGLTKCRYFLVVGSAAPHKNINLAVEAAQQVESEGVKTVLVGEANPKIFGRSGYASQSAVVLAGRVSDGELKALYQNALSLVFPSRYEGFGIPLIEAAMCGCPVIASDIPVAREVCGENAQFVPVGDLAALVQAMRDRVHQPRLDRTPTITPFSWPRTAMILLQAATQLKARKSPDA